MRAPRQNNKLARAQHRARKILSKTEAMSHFARAADAPSMGTVGVKVDVVRGLAVREAHAKIIDEHGRTLAKNDNVKSVGDTLTLDAQPS